MFTELDAEFEKYFNEYEQVSKLQRLLEKDTRDIMGGFVDLIEKNLRVNLNVKESFYADI